MSMPQLPGSKGKIAAFILFGVAAVALILGIVSLSTGGDGDNGQAAGNTAGTQAPVTPGNTPGQSGSPGSTPTATQPAPPKPGPITGPATPAPPGKTTTVIEPPPAAGGPQPAGQPVGDKSADVRVYNNGTIKHLASQAADRLRRDGYRVVSVANYPQGVIPTTTVYYRPGTGEEATANSIAQDIGARAAPRFPGLADASPGVIVIVTNDYKA